MFREYSEDLLVKEKQILNELYSNIDNNKSTIMNSGAGSGKTYALVECLKYVLKTKGKTLENNNQHVVCITYTNVAANEISERINNSSIILISTIHQRLWELIKNYQKELLELHSEKIECEIIKLENEIDSNEKYKAFNELSNKEKTEFVEIIKSQKDIYYEIYNLKAADFRRKLGSYIANYSCLLKNVTTFKSYVNNVFRIEKYKECLDKIINSEDGYEKVEYNTMYNTDKLYRMIVSHDTILEYGLKMIEKYNILKEIIIDSYPIFFVDEYQDTSEKVVRILSELQKYSRKISHPFFVGYFGDNVQSIYEDGIGNSLQSIHDGLCSVNKNINRRSCAEVIEVANRIRNDDIWQESIYKDSNGGKVKFFVGTKEDINDFILDSKGKLLGDTDGQLHCFMLTNESVASYSGFEKFYGIFKRFPFYKRNYDQLTTETLSNDLKKLGDVQLLLYNTIDLYVALSNEKTLVSEIIDTRDIQELNIEKLRTVVNKLKRINGGLLIDLFRSIDALCKDKDEIYKKILQKKITIEALSINRLKKYIKQKMFFDLTNDEEDTSVNESIEEMLNSDLIECVKWYKYINRQYDDSVVYHTFHGTKGLEFDNVVIILGNSFGRQKHFFDIYFNNRQNEKNVPQEIKNTYFEAKNLLYVSVTRAKINLRILYVDDISEFNEQISEVFNIISKFPL